MATVGDRMHIIVDGLDKSIYDLTNTFAEACQSLMNAPDGGYTIETWEYSNSLEWLYEQDSEYIVQNSIVYKKKYDRVECTDFLGGMK